MNDEPLVSIRVLRPILAGLVAQGKEVEAELAAVGLEPATLGDPDARVSHRLAIALWDHAVETTGDPSFGLHVAQSVDITVFDVLAYAITTSSTVVEGLRRLLLTPTARGMELEHRLPAQVLPRAVSEFVLGVWLAVPRQTTGRDIVPLRVWFRHAKPSDTAELEAHFRCPMEFDTGRNLLEFSEETLELPQLQANPGLVAVLDRHAKDLLQRLPAQQPASVASRARALIATELQGGNPSAERIAQSLQLSVRTLSRRLADEGTSHKQLLEELRRELAQRYLREQQLAAEEVAFLLGYSEASAFHRAFKRWTGETPAQFRAAP